MHVCIQAITNMTFKIYIDPQLDTDPTDARYNRHGDDFTKLKGLTSQQPLQLPPLGDNKPPKGQPVNTQEFKPLFNPRQTYVHLR